MVVCVIIDRALSHVEQLDAIVVRGLHTLCVVLYTSHTRPVEPYLLHVGLSSSHLRCQFQVR